MTLTVRISQEAEQRLREEAARLGMSEAEYVQQLVERSLPADRPITDQATLDLLAQWDAEDQTDDPTELARRHQEWDEFRKAMNEHSLSGRPVYP